MNLYQKHAVSLSQLFSTLIIPDLTDIPHIILSVSPCRSGTTVMLRVMAVMGAAAYFQPLKNLLRWQMQDVPFVWVLPTGASQTIYLKETLGPYTLAESIFNPLSFLLEAGVPPAKLHVWLYGRYPLDSYASWLKWWRGKTDITHFIASYHTLATIYEQATQANISTTTLTYEVFGRYPPNVIIPKLAQRFGLPYTERAIEGWQQLAAFGSPGSNIFLPQEPPIFITPGIHDTVHEATQFVYQPMPPQALEAISRDEQQQMEQAGLFALYASWQTACEKDLEIQLLERS